MSKPLTFVTGNAKKLEEVIAILGSNFPREVVSQKVDLPELQGEIDDICVKKVPSSLRDYKRSLHSRGHLSLFQFLGGSTWPLHQMVSRQIGARRIVQVVNRFRR
jgi:hypothetical protein